jgi:translocation and assembly module TamB
VPGARLRLGDTYAMLHGHGKIAWRDQRLVADATVAAAPVPGKSLPPLAASLHGWGDTTSFTLAALEATLPGLTARLSEPVTMERSGTLRAGAARFLVAADLAQLPWFAARGAITGEARLVPRLGATPVVEFQIAAHNLAAAGWSTRLVQAQGQLDWPRLRVTAGTAVGAAGEDLTWRGGWDFATKEIFGGAVAGRILGSSLARWLPANLTCETFGIDAEAAGPLAALSHTGKIQVEQARFRSFPPARVALSWAGRGPVLASFGVSLTSGATTLSAAGAADQEAVRLSHLELTQLNQLCLRLTTPTEIRWHPAWQISSCALVGPDARLTVSGQCGATGQLALSAVNIPSIWLRDFGARPGFPWRVSSLEAQGAWDRGPMTFSLAARGEIEWRTGTSAVLAAAARGDSTGVVIEEFGVVEAGRSVVRVAGRIPLTFTPGAPRIAAWQPDGALELQVATEPVASFWRELATLTGVTLEQPEAEAHLSGTWAKPQGALRVRATRLAVDPARSSSPLPTLENLQLDLVFEPTEVRLTQLALSCEGQSVRAQGRLPMTSDRWRALPPQPLAWALREAEVQVEIPGAEVAAFARFLPGFVVGKGTLQADVRYAQGQLHGFLRLRDAATRPWGSLGALQEINAQVQLAGRALELAAVSAQYGGQAVTLAGNVQLPDFAAATNEADRGVAAWRFDLRLTGEDLPLLRQTGVLVRADLDLKLTTPARGAPRIAGTVQLRKSLLLSDVRALLPGGARTKARPPPYFAVGIAPFDTWRLDVEVQGDRFLKLRTALFNGEVSSRFRLNGSLGDPQLRGDATIHDGVVKLPFANFVVQEGRVSISPEQGVEPEVWLVGTVRRQDYDLRLEATGPASAPLVVFSSSPPLESGQVLLMVMTGESPREGLVYTDRQRMARLGTFLGQSLLSNLGRENGAAERLSLSTGERASRQGRETYGFEYRIADRWSLVGEYDEFDEFNAGVKWRVYSRGGSREEPTK